MLLNQTIYYLNKSKSKWISVGLYYPFEFASVVKIFGRSKQYVIFKEEEWIQFHEQRENMNKHFQTFDTIWEPRQIGSKTLTFEMIKEKRLLKIKNMSGNEVYLGWESVSEVWSLELVFRYRLSYSSGSNFKYFYEDVIRAVAEMSGDVKINIYNIINRRSEKSDDVCCMLEILLFMPEKALFDVQLERRIQEQEQHWTKAVDLKSVVERLYEELGALEFDADHEAIYGMERYYTVQQCEELRDKYKIGRKLNQFSERYVHPTWVKEHVQPIPCERLVVFHWPSAHPMGTMNQPINAPELHEDMFSPEQTSFLQKLFRDIITTMREKEAYYKQLLDSHVALQQEFAELKSAVSAATEDEEREVSIANKATEYSFDVDNASTPRRKQTISSADERFASILEQSLAQKNVSEPKEDDDEYVLFVTR
ncbi:hypothetical protein FQA39_LY16483 [Lamprigera yunnana]|nr:hypothetical protein FQA39_LY16483 [Lamprigera yunnana]